MKPSDIPARVAEAALVRAFQQAQAAAAVAADAPAAAPTHEDHGPRRSGAELQALLEAINRSQACVEYDLQGRVVAANDHFLALMNLRFEEIRGEHHRLFVDTATSTSPAYREFWRQLQQGQCHSGEFLRLGRNGRRVWLQATYAPVLGPDRRPARVVAWCTDITAQKLARLENHARLQAVAADSFHFELDAKGHYCQVSDSLAQLLGLHESELLGQPARLLEGADPSSPDPWPELRAGRCVQLAVNSPAAGGRALWLQLSLSPLIGLDGQLAKVHVLGRDTTQQRLDELDTRGKLAAIDRSQAVVEFSLQGELLSANGNFLALFGYSAAELQGAHHRLFVAADEAQHADYQAFWEQLSLGQYQAGEYLRLAKDGRKVWIQATYTPVFDAQHRPVRVVKVAVDVTADRLQNAAFQAQVTAVDRSHAVIEFGLDGRVTDANRNFLAAMGYTLREVQGRHHVDFCPPEYALSDEYRDFWLRLNEGQSISGRFLRVGNRGRQVWLQATYSPVLDLSGRPRKVVKYAYDVTREVRLEQRIAALSGQVQDTLAQLTGSLALIATRSGVAAVTAHDARRCAQEGLQALQKAIYAINRMQGSSEQVQAVVQRIATIAEQSHMLALNAAIEAVRAGGDGTGFAVVAQAVRELADRSAEAAAETSRLIEESAGRVANGAAITQEVSAVLLAILERVGQTGNSVGAIAMATDHQREMAAAVHETLVELKQRPVLRRVA